MSRRFEQLAAEERVALAALKLQGHGVRHIARQLGRSPSTISREVSRNAGAAGYASQDAQQRFAQRRQAARPAARLDPDGPLWPVVSHMLGWCWSPQQIAPHTARLLARRARHACLARDHLQRHLRPPQR